MGRKDADQECFQIKDMHKVWVTLAHRHKEDNTYGCLWNLASSKSCRKKNIHEQRLITWKQEDEKQHSPGDLPLAKTSTCRKYYPQLPHAAGLKPEPAPLQRYPTRAKVSQLSFSPVLINYSGQVQSHASEAEDTNRTTDH